MSGEVTKYLIRVGKRSTSLIEERHLAINVRHDAPDDPMEVVMDFEAVCRCAAKKVYASHVGHEPPDTASCDLECPHYKEVNGGR